MSAVRTESPQQRQAVAQLANQQALEVAVLRTAIAEIRNHPDCSGRACALATLRRLVNERINSLELIATRREGGHA